MTDETTVCEYCFGTGQKVEMRLVKLGATLAPYEPCPYCTKPKPPQKPARYISKIAAARRKRRP